jgi:hypothetical protein
MSATVGAGDERAMSAGARLLAPPIVLDAVAATACPVKVRHAYEVAAGSRPQRTGRPGGPTDPAVEHREGERSAFVAGVLERLLETFPRSADLRTVAPGEDRQALTVQLIRAGQDLIVGPTLPADPGGHRAGSPDALLRSDDGTARPSYQPVLVRWHRLLRRRRAEDPAEDRPPSPLAADGFIADQASLAELTSPMKTDPPSDEHLFRFDTRRADFLQLAHHHRLLEAMTASGGPWGLVVGTDFPPADPRIAWVRLDRPAVRVVDRDLPSGWRWRSLLAEADAELRQRVTIAETFSAATPRAPDPQTARLAEPVVIDECRTCPWWSACRAELDPDDLSLRIARGRLDRLEVTALRALGVATVADLSTADVEALLPAYLPEVAHRPDAEPRLRAIARRAKMLERGEPIERETSGPISVPAATVEIDLDIETSAAGRIYLWGFEVSVDGGSHYVEFSRFADLDESDEAALAREALGWLRHQVDGPRSVRVFHYSGYEVAMIEALAARCPSDELLDWARTFACGEFVDLLEIVQAHFFGAAGLGLKQIAVTAGFGWRDPDPGGLNSQRWFADAVHAAAPETRAAARRRVLAYNEDDVRATAHLRAWLRAL